jgi:hypothetical protein
MSEEDDEEPRISQEQFDILQRRAIHNGWRSEDGNTYMTFPGGYNAIVDNDMTYTFRTSYGILLDVSPDDFIKMLDKALK